VPESLALSEVIRQSASSSHDKSLNVLTEIRLPDYSAEMISEFATLLDKIRLLAEAMQTLRSENADLRGKLSALGAENIALAARMGEAHERVTALLQTMPEVASDEEAA
jgi:FtsZ-binding cell division protein ZapB